MSYNVLHKIDELSCMDKLEYLDLGNNRIFNGIPFLTLQNCKGLRDLIIWNNPIQEKNNVYKLIAQRNPNLFTIDYIQKEYYIHLNHDGQGLKLE